MLPREHNYNVGAETKGIDHFMLSGLRNRCSLLLFTLFLIPGCRRTPSAPSTKVKPVAVDRPALSVPEKTAATAESAPTRPSGPIRFFDVTSQSGIHFRHNSGAFGKKYLPETMGSGVCVLDYDNDGWQDILFVNSMDWQEHKTSKSFPALYHNNKDGTFTDVTHQAGLDVETYGLGCAAADYDNDGFVDVYVTALEGNHLFRNV